MTQPVSGQNLKLPGREEDNLCENNILASKPNRQLPTGGTMVDQSQNVDSELDQNSPLPSLKRNHWLFNIWAPNSSEPVSVLQ